MNAVTIPLEMTADEIQRRWPATIPVFLRWKVACVGCPMAMFDTLADVARTYGLPLERLRHEMEQAAQEGAA